MVCELFHAARSRILARSHPFFHQIGNDHPCPDCKYDTYRCFLWIYCTYKVYEPIQSVLDLRKNRKIMMFLEGGYTASCKLFSYPILYTLVEQIFYLPAWLHNVRFVVHLTCFGEIDSDSF